MNRFRVGPGTLAGLSATVVVALTAFAGIGTARAADAGSRMPDGHPDLNGTWDNGSGIDFVKPQRNADGSVCVAGCDSPPPPPPPVAAKPAGGAKPAAAAGGGRPAFDMPKYKPEFLSKVRDLDKRQVKMDPVLRCKSPGVPRIGPPDKIVQTARQMVFLYDDVSGAFWRIVPTDGRKHRTDVDESYLGDSVGHWEGDTLVVDVTKFNDDTWLTDNGAFHSTSLHVTERLHRVGNTLEYDAVVEDPKVLQEPWKPKQRLAKLSDSELAEPAPCADQDLGHLVDDTHHNNPR